VEAQGGANEQWRYPADRGLVSGYDDEAKKDVAWMKWWLAERYGFDVVEETVAYVAP